MFFVPVYLSFVFFVIPLSFLWNIFSFSYLGITWNNIKGVGKLDCCPLCLDLQEKFRIVGEGSYVIPISAEVL